MGGAWMCARVMRWRAAVAWRPEWPYAAVVILAWVALLTGHAWPTSKICSALPRALTLPDLVGTGTGIWSVLPALGLMSVAMMLPAALPGARHVALNSLRWRRQRAMAIYVMVFTATWIGFGVLVLAGQLWLRAEYSVRSGLLMTTTLAAAAVWQLSKPKRRALLQCQRTVPLPMLGARADAGCAHMGLLQGRRCLQSCWALMLVTTAWGHDSLSGLLLMLAITGFVMMEQFTRKGRSLRWPSAGALALASGMSAMGIV